MTVKRLSGFTSMTRSKILLGFLLLLLFLHPFLFAQGKAAQGLVFSISYCHQGITKGFDGNTFYGAVSDLVLVPKIGAGNGAALSGGYRWKRYSAEFSISYSRHDWTHTYDPQGNRATVAIFSGVVKRFFNIQKNFQPYLQAGLDFPLLVIPDLATTYIEYESVGIWETKEIIKRGTPVFWSAGIGLGGGLSIQATENWAFFIDGMLHGGLLITLSASTMGSQDVIPVFVMGYTVRCGISYTFSR